MHTIDQEEGRYRVLLVGIEGNTEEKRETFCKSISEIYGIPFLLLKKVVDHCPTVLKKNLSLKRAEVLARTLRSFGALVSVEEKRDSSAVFLEFQGTTPHRVALESSYFRRTEGGAWNVMGRASNLSGESLTDTWVLVQAFDDYGELLAFEEIPIPINPLPPGETSPFKVIFEGDLPIRRVSLAFKNSSGLPLSAVDRRTKREWVEVRLLLKDEDGSLSPSSFVAVDGEAETSSMDITEVPEGIFRPLEAKSLPVPVGEEKESDETAVRQDFDVPPELMTCGHAAPEMVPDPLQRDLNSPLEGPGQSIIQMEKNEEIVSRQESPQTVTLSGSEKHSTPMTSQPNGQDLPSTRDSGEPFDRLKALSSTEGLSRAAHPEGSEVNPEPGVLSLPLNTGLRPAERVNLPDLEFHPPQRESMFPETRFDVSIFEEVTKLLEEISESNLKREKEKPPSFPWMEDFRNSIETYYQKRGNLFFSWFEGQREGGRFANPLHALLTILVHARFNQKNQSETALENTKKVVELILRPNLLLEEIPVLEGTPFFSGENWRDLFHRAIPKLQHVAKEIIEKQRWGAVELERLIQIIPHMSDKNSRMAMRWIHELIPETTEIDFSNTAVSVGESLYRVTSRLGVVDPNLHFCQGKDSIGHLKIQTFARTAYPQYPIKIEDPMIWTGTTPEEGGGGYCLPAQPRCEGCLFETFCPKLYIGFDPSKKGLGGGR
jgi:hypothetical protein